MSEKAHKVMTPEEYAAMPIIGWHSVYRDIDGYGAIGIRFHTDGAASPPLRAREEIFYPVGQIISAGQLAAELRIAAQRLTICAAPKEFVQRFHSLADAILSSTAGQEWRDISSAPKDEQRILGTDGVSRFVMFWRGANHLPHQDKPGWNLSGGVQRLFPTHWMPLPAPPVAEPLLAEKQTP